MSRSAPQSGERSVLHIYLDESGDLGWSEGSSQYLVIATVCTRDRRLLRKLVRGVKRRHRIPLDVELKGFESSSEVRADLLQAIAQRGACYCRAIVVYKPRVVARLQATNLLYNYAAGILLADHIKGLDRVRLVADPREVKVNAPYTFDEYLRIKLYGDLGSQVDLQIEQPDSRMSPGIQAADVLANAVFRHFERGETACFGCIRGRLEVRKLYFPPEGV